MGGSERRAIRFVTNSVFRLCVALLVAGWVVARAPVMTDGAAVPKVTIDTTVVTTVANFEFNAYFGPSLAPISCELLHKLKESATKRFTQAYCMSATTKLVHHATLSASGVVKRCVGVNCGSNPGLGTPDFNPGTMVRSGPFTCVISTSAVTCTVADGKGFVFTLGAIRVI
jgi:hypothetical protein